MARRHEPPLATAEPQKQPAVADPAHLSSTAVASWTLKPSQNEAAKSPSLLRLPASTGREVGTWPAPVFVGDHAVAVQPHPSLDAPGAGLRRLDAEGGAVEAQPLATDKRPSRKEARADDRRRHSLLQRRGGRGIAPIFGAIGNSFEENLGVDQEKRPAVRNQIPMVAVGRTEQVQNCGEATGVPIESFQLRIIGARSMGDPFHIP